MARRALLALLSDGQFHSGQDLAERLGVSRTAVWKQLKTLRERSGLAIDSVRGRGYRIEGGLDLLHASTIHGGLSAQARGLLRELLLLETVDSTNAAVLRRAAAGAGAGLVCSAERQTAGRGRRGRHWVSPFASNLYVSVLWRYEEGARALEGLSLAVGVAAARALAVAGLSGIRLKWPNDILHGGAKLGGILLEMTGDAAGVCEVAVGIGLNVAMPAAAARAIDQRWTDVAQASDAVPPGRNELLAALLNELLPLLDGYGSSGLAPWSEPWRSLDALSGAAVVLDTGSHRLAGTARGVDDRGALRLETAAGVQSVFAGEVSLRVAQT